jgi:outer membrane protein
VEKINQVLTYVLLAAVAVLFYFQFSGKEETPKKNVSVIDQAAVDSLTQNISVAFVNTDSLWSTYKLVDEAYDDLDKKKSEFDKKFNNKQVQLEKQFTAKAMSLQSKAEAYDANASTMGEFEAKQKLMELQEMDQQLQQDQVNAQKELASLQEQYGSQLLKVEAEKNKLIQDKIKKHIKQYNEDHGFTYILAYANGGAILHGDVRLDITQDVVAGLNAEYTAEKQKALESK